MFRDRGQGVSLSPRDLTTSSSSSLFFLRTCLKISSFPLKEGMSHTILSWRVCAMRKVTSWVTFFWCKLSYEVSHAGTWAQSVRLSEIGCAKPTCGATHREKKKSDFASTPEASLRPLARHSLLYATPESSHFSDFYYHGLFWPLFQTYANGIRQHIFFCTWLSILLVEAGEAVVIWSVFTADLYSVGWKCNNLFSGLSWTDLWVVSDIWLWRILLQEELWCVCFKEHMYIFLSVYMKKCNFWVINSGVLEQAWTNL